MKEIFELGDCVLGWGQFRGVITEVNKGSAATLPGYAVKWETGQTTFVYHSLREVVRLCNNCGYPRSVHTEADKCLYAPTSWK